MNNHLCRQQQQHQNMDRMNSRAMMMMWWIEKPKWAKSSIWMEEQWIAFFFVIYNARTGSFRSLSFTLLSVLLSKFWIMRRWWNFRYIVGFNLSWLQTHCQFHYTEIWINLEKLCASSDNSPSTPSFIFRSRIHRKFWALAFLCRKWLSNGSWICIIISSYSNYAWWWLYWLSHLVSWSNIVCIWKSNKIFINFTLLTISI